jgi:hypothetical protein
VATSGTGSITNQNIGQEQSCLEPADEKGFYGPVITTQHQ